VRRRGESKLNWLRNVSKTAIVYIVQALTGVAIIVGAGPDEAQEVAEGIGEASTQLIGAALILKSAIDAYIRKVTEQPMLPGVKGLLFKR
jgi:hypothetical protein